MDLIDWMIPFEIITFLTDEESIFSPPEIDLIEASNYCSQTYSYSIDLSISLDYILISCGASWRKSTSDDHSSSLLQRNATAIAFAFSI